MFYIRFKIYICAPILNIYLYVCVCIYIQYTSSRTLCSDAWNSPLFAKRDAESLEGARGWGKEGWGLSRRKREKAERAISRYLERENPLGDGRRLWFPSGVSPYRSGTTEARPPLIIRLPTLQRDPSIRHPSAMPISGIRQHPRALTVCLSFWRLDVAENQRRINPRRFAARAEIYIPASVYCAHSSVQGVSKPSIFTKEIWQSIFSDRNFFKNDCPII